MKESNDNSRSKPKPRSRRLKKRTASRVKPNGASPSDPPLTSFLNHLPGFAWMKDLKGRYIYANSALQALKEYRDGCIGLTDAELLRQDIADISRANDQKVIAERKPLEILEPYLVDGEKHFMLVSKFPIFDPSGALIMIGGSSIDISAQARTEERLREYERAVEGVEEMIAVIDRDYRYLMANEAFLAHRGMPREQVVGRFVWDVLTEETFTQSVKPKLDQAFAGNVVRYEMQHRYPTLGLRELSVSYFPIEGAHGVDRVTCVLQDITERKAATNALNEAERHYREIFENAGEGIFQSTPAGRYIAANPALARMQGFDSPEELMRGRTDISRDTYVDPARREEFKRLLETNGSVREFEFQLSRKDGSKISVSVNARVVRGKNGVVQYYEGTGQDISERKTAQARSAAFASLARKLSGTSTQLEAAQIIVDTARELFGWDACNLDLYDPALGRVEPMLNMVTIDGKLVNVTPLIKNGALTNRMRRVIEHGPELIPRKEPTEFDGEARPFGDNTRPSRSIMTVPVLHSSKVIGLLSIQSYTANAYDQASLAHLEALADHCGEALNRIRTEQSLRESEERFRQMAEHFEDVIWIADRNLEQVLYINPAYERIFGRSVESLYGRFDSFLEGVHPEDRTCVDQMQERQKQGKCKPFEYRIVRPDGSIRWILRRSFPIRDDHGRILRIAGISQDVTERKRAESQLRESEERYRDLVENSQEFICTHDLNGVILSANRAASEVLGYDLKDWCGKRNYRDLLVPEVRDQFDDYLARLSRDGVASGLTLVQTSSGERRILEYHNTVRTEGVATPIVRGMARDITEQRRAEKAMSALRRELELTMNSMEEGVHRVDLKGNIVFENPAAARMLGWEVAQLLGKRGHSTMHHTRPDGTPYPQEECPIYTSFRDGVSRHVADEVFWRQDGTSFPVEYQTAPMRNDRNEIVATVVTFRDITVRKQVEVALYESEERYRELFENSRDAIHVHDLNGRYISVNRAAETLSGFTRAEIMGKHYSNFITPKHLKNARESFCIKLDAPIETTYEAEIICKNGTPKAVEVSSRMIYKDGVAVAIQGTARDITERKRAQQALQTYARRLLEAQEAERQNIARELHDEIGQILTAVSLNLHSIQKSCQTDACLPNIDESIQVVEDALSRVRELSLELRPSLLDDLGLAAALRWYVGRYTARSGIATEILGDADIGRISHEVETACFRITQEALTNAARHSQATRATVLIERTNGNLELKITDNGIGFNFDQLLYGMASALSLGLRGMQERALAVKGRVQITSKPGQGTQVTLNVPVKQ